MQSHPPTEPSDPLEKPIIGYAGQFTPSANQIARELRRKQRGEIPTEGKIAAAIVGIAVLGGCAGHPIAELMIVPLIGCAIWYVHVRVGRRKRTPRRIRIVMQAAATASLLATLALIVTVAGKWDVALLIPAVWNWFWILVVCVAVFAVAEAVSIVHWIRERRRLRQGVATMNPVVPALPTNFTPS